MNGGAVAGIIAGCIAALVSLLAFITSSRATRIQATASAKAVDAGAYERAQRIYEASLHELEVQVARLQGQTQQMSSQLAVSEDTIRDLRTQLTQVQATREQEIRDLRTQMTIKESMIQTLQGRIAELRAQLGGASALPPPDTYGDAAAEAGS